MVDRSFPMFLFTPPGVTWEGMREMIGRLAVLKAETLIFTDTGNRAAIVASGNQGEEVGADLREAGAEVVATIAPDQVISAVGSSRVTAVPESRRSRILSPGQPWYSSLSL